MTLLDFIIVGLYFISMLCIGFMYGRGNTTSDDYFLGGRKMRSWTVGLSLFATLMSTITYLAMPGEVIKHGPMILSGLLAVPLIMWIVGWFIIPAFMQVSATSAYEILEHRFGFGIRLLGTVFFLILRLMWMAMVIYLTSKAVVGPVIDLDPRFIPLVSLVLGMITVGYTSIGGLRAVVLSDVIQTFVLFGGAILTIIIVTFDLNGFSWIPKDWNPLWDAPKVWFDPEARVTFAGAITLFFFWYICTAGGDQMAIQRYFATSSVKNARWAFNVSILSTIVIQLLLMFLGFALFAFYRTRLETNPVGELSPDMMFPDFISNHLPVGVSGLVIAALLAAAMSSLSSGLSSVSSVVSVDLIGRLSTRSRDDTTKMNTGRRVSWLVGLVVVGMSLAIGKVSGNFLELTNKTSIFVAPLFFLFFMALFVPFSTVLGTWLGVLVSVFFGIGIAFFNLWELSFIWIIPSSLLFGMFFGIIASILQQAFQKRFPGI